MRWFAAKSDPVVPAAPRRPVATIPRSTSGTPLELSSIAWANGGIGRETALSIPAVAACRNLIVGTVVQLALYKYRGGDRLEPDYLVSKPDPSLVLPATLGGTVDDLVFYGRAYWRILDRDSDGFARRARWTPVMDVTPQATSNGGAYSTLTGYRIAGIPDVVAPDDLIRFDSCIPGVLDVGARTLSGALETYEAQRRMAAVELPAGVLKNEGTELSEDEAQEYVERFSLNRRAHAVALLQGMSYTRESLSPADLQLLEMTDSVATEVARLFNVPVAMISGSPSGNASALLYANLSMQRALVVQTAVAPHLRTVESTLSDVYPRGTSVAFDVQTFLRSDPQAASEYVLGLLAAGVIDQTEARSMLGIPSAPPAVAPDLTPGRV